MGNDRLSTNSEYDNHSSINFPLQYALNQVDSNIDLLDEVILTDILFCNQTQNQCVPRKQEIQECE